MLLELRGLLDSGVAREIARGLAEAPFSDGRATAQGSARDLKENRQLDPGHPIAKSLGAVVLGALGRSEAFKAGALPRTILPVTFCRYIEGMAYGEHLDVPIMGTAAGPLRTDLSLTVWLSPRESYEGGELVIQGDAGHRAFKGEAGDALVYPSTALHHVTPVTRGERLVAISWIQSLVRDPEQRAVLFSLVETMNTLAQRGGAEAELTRLRQIHYRLIRFWAEC